MHPNTPRVLSELVGHAETLRRSHGKTRLDLEKLDALGAEIDDIAARPSEEDPPLIDELTQWLFKCVRNAADDPWGRQQAKWIMLMTSFLPFVQTNGARAMELAARVGTTAQSRDGR